MPDQVVPITGLADVGVILDNPPVSLPPNAFTNARNVRFRDGAVRKMEGEVDIFEGINGWLSNPTNNLGQLQYIAWWPNPNQTTRDAGYYVFVIENTRDSDNIVHDIYAMLPGETNSPTRIGENYSRQGKWQHTLFNGGFTFIINNGIERPQYITDPEGNLDITVLQLTDLPGWDSYQVNEILLRDTFSDTSSSIFDTGQSREAGITQYVVTLTRGDIVQTINEEPNGYTVTEENNQDVITFAPGVLINGDEVQVNFQSTNPVEVRAAIVRAFGDFLVAGNLVERDSVAPGNPIIRRLTGVVRSSDVAQPGSIPNNWNPFAAGVSTADEFVIADTGTVQDMVPLQGNMYLYTNTSISVMRPTGNPTIPLAVQPVTDQYGALTTDSVLEYDGKHFVIGSNDIYLFGGHPGSIQSISDKKVRDAFFERVNPINDNTRNLFTLRYAAKDEIWICFPTVDSVRGESDEAYIWNYRHGTWTIRELHSVIRGDVGPVPGGGIPSAIISFDGESGTNDIIQVGSREVQTLQVSSDARVGHASAASRPEQYSFRTERSVASVDRPALDLDAPELVEVQIGDDFYSGPNPALQEYNIINIPDITIGAFASGGARFIIEYTRVEANTGNDNRRITVHANEIYGNSSGAISGTDFASALANHLDGLPEFQDWTITSTGTTINLLSDYAGMRELRGLDITTFTATVENLIPDPNLFTGEGPHEFTDSFGDELFTVSRTGTGPYTFSVATARDTGFIDSDSITQLAFITDGTTFATPDPFNRDSGTFTFPSTSGEFSLRTTPPANFVNLVQETDRIPNNGLLDDDLAVEDGVTIRRNEVEGGYTRTSSESTTPLNDTNENVTVTVTESSTTSNTNTAVIGNSSSVVDSGGFNINIANQLVRTYTSTAGNPRAWRVSDRTQVRSACSFTNRLGDNTCTHFQGATGWNPPQRPSDSILLNDWNHPAGSGAKTIITSWDTGTSVPNPHQSGATIQIIYGGFGIEYANGVRLFYATSSTRPSNNEFVGFSNQGANNLSGATISTHTGNVRVVVGGTEQVNIPRRNFRIVNSNPFDIRFTAQGTGVGSVAAGQTIVFQGTTGSADESWSWVNNPITFGGTAIGGSGTSDLTGTNGRRETTLNGVTVVSQNTSSPQSTTTGSARDQAVLLPANNGNNIGATRARTETWNPTRDFSTVNWRTGTSSEQLAAYRLSNGVRVTNGRPTGRRDTNPPAGWGVTAFESGVITPTLEITASNITNPVTLGFTTRTVQRGTLDSNSQGTFCRNLVAATATSNFAAIGSGSINGEGIRQSGSAANSGPAVGIQGARGNNGFPWTVPSTGRSNECGGNLRAGSSFNSEVRVYTPDPNRATGVRIIVNGPFVTTSVTVPRASSETFTVTNNNPFAVIISAGGQSLSVAADSTSTLTVTGSEGNSWTVSTPTTTNYQYVLTNNNARALVAGFLTHGSENIDLTDLAPGDSVSSSFSTVRTASVSFVREIEQSGSMTVSTDADLILLRSGIGTVPTDPNDLESVRYNFSVNFTDNTPDIDIDYQTPENRDPSDSDNLNNIGAVEGFVRALAANDAFNMYFELHVNAALNGVTAIVDPEVQPGRFRIEARDAPGVGVMPPHDAISIDAEVDQMNGGNADITVQSIQRGVNTDNDPVSISILTGTRVPQPDGSFMRNIASTHTVILNGNYPSTEDGDLAITEVVRDHLRLDTSFDNLWNVNTTTPPTSANPNLMFTSDNNGPHYIMTDQVAPASSGLTPQFFTFESTQQGITTTENPTYPTISLMPPISEPQTPVEIMLNPLPTDTSTDRLNHFDIVDIVRARFNYDGWTVISADDPNIGAAPNAAQIRFARTLEGEVVSGVDQTMGWRVGNISYGNTGRTLPGDAAVTDGLVVGRLNPDDFVRVDSLGPVSDTNPLITAVGMGDNLDFRGSRTERSQRTHIMVEITNPDITSLDPVIDPMTGNLVTNDDGTIALQPGNTQYIPIITGGSGNYNPVNQAGSQPGIARTADEIVTIVQSRINAVNRRVQVTRNGNELSIIPSQFSELANFVVGVFLNDSNQNVERWNAIINANSDTQSALVSSLLINTLDNGGIQSTVPANIDSGTDEQFNPGNRRPNFSTRSVETGGRVTNTSIINEVFDPLRPWPTTQVNLNREFPIFVTSIIDDAGTIVQQNFRGADLGFLNLTAPYESFVERIEMAVTPEFDTEQIQALALWGDGGSQVTFGEPINQAILNVNMYGTNAPGSTQGTFNTGMQNMVANDFIIGDDYKIDMRIHGRFLNLRITDNVTDDEGQSRNVSQDTGLGVDRGISWNISGMQADIVKGGRR